jgi:sec-independent protein translocase protein TatA
VPNIGIGEMVLIFLVVLLLFGAKRLPEIGSSLGKGIREFKGSMREVQNEIKPLQQASRLVTAPGATIAASLMAAPSAEVTPRREHAVVETPPAV